jgi:hypothetical protein
MNRIVVTWNMRGLSRDKVQHLRSFLTERKPLAVVLTETHNTSTSPQSWPRFRGYTIFPLPANSNRAGGMAFLFRADCVACQGPLAVAAASSPASMQAAALPQSHQPPRNGSPLN